MEDKGIESDDEFEKLEHASPAREIDENMPNSIKITEIALFLKENYSVLTPIEMGPLLSAYNIVSETDATISQLLRCIRAYCFLMHLKREI